jgi:hypothetical protein
LLPALSAWESVAGGGGSWQRRKPAHRLIHRATFGWPFRCAADSNGGRRPAGWGVFPEAQGARRQSPGPQRSRLAASQARVETAQGKPADAAGERPRPRLEDRRCAEELQDFGPGVCYTQGMSPGQHARPFAPVDATCAGQRGGDPPREWATTSRRDLPALGCHP